jgi:uncharacterized protein (UPF0335 family)
MSKSEYEILKLIIIRIERLEKENKEMYDLMKEIVEDRR